MMNITDIRIRRTYQDARLRAVVSVTIDNDLAIHDIKVIEGPQRLFVAMPSRRDEGGVYRDIAPGTQGAGGRGPLPLSGAPETDPDYGNGLRPFHGIGSRDGIAGGPPCQAGASRLFFALKQSPCFNVHQAAFGGV